MEFNDGDYQLPNFESYQDYVRHFNTTQDRRFLPGEIIQQQVVKLGYRSAERIYTDDEFYNRRNMVIEASMPKNVAVVCFSDNIKIDDPVLKALRTREPLNMQKKVSTIIFIRTHNKGGFELTGYIDFEQSCRDSYTKMPGAVNWTAVFKGQRLLKPKKTDLSFHDASKKLITYNQTDNFDVLHVPKYGVMFKHRGDHKVLPIGPYPPEQYKDNCIRTMIYSPKYGFVVFYDHNVRKKN